MLKFKWQKVPVPHCMLHHRLLIWDPIMKNAMCGVLDLFFMKCWLDMNFLNMLKQRSNFLAKFKSSILEKQNLTIPNLYINNGNQSHWLCSHILTQKDHLLLMSFNFTDKNTNQCTRISVQNMVMKCQVSKTLMTVWDWQKLSVLINQSLTLTKSKTCLKN